MMIHLPKDRFGYGSPSAVDSPWINCFFILLQYCIFYQFIHPLCHQHTNGFVRLHGAIDRRNL